MADRPFPWRSLRKSVQWLAFTAWIIVWVKTAGTPWPAGFSRLTVHLDPLLALAVTLAGRTLIGGLLLSLVTVGITLIFGRAWCGWLCPVGTVLDIFPFRNSRKRLLPEPLRKTKFLLLAAILLAALFGNLSLLLLDPMTLWTRTLTGSVAPALNTAFTAFEVFLARVPWLDAPLQWFDQLVRPAILPLEPIGVRVVWLPLLLFTVIILLNRLAERFWCRYLCPLGGFLGWISKFALFKRRVAADCSQCGLCARACPTGTIDAERGFASDAAECTMCMDCVSGCPRGSASFTPAFSLQPKQVYDPSRRDFLITGAVTLTSLAVLETIPSLLQGPSTLLRPPGVDADHFLSQCVRCGLCLRACPTGALQPAITESGLRGLFSPVLVPRLGYCQYSCNRCGEVCPTTAIPNLPLEEKRRQVIGKAFINENRCLPWAEGVTCLVCEEMCPLPQKAITLEEREVVQADGSKSLLRLPRVQQDLCIGCGICENKCPRAGTAAIQVYRADE